MNNFLKLFVAFIFAGLLFSCKKNISMITFDGGTAPVLTADRTTIPMGFATKDQEAVTLSWSNPNYKFSTGLSSQNVSYTLEIDTTGANFTSPVKQSVSGGFDLSKTFTQSDLNVILFNQMKLKADVPHNIDVRVTSSLVNSSVPMVSNVLKFTVTPYSIPPKINPPSTGALYIIGSATPAGWPNPVPEQTQKFTQVSSTLYEISIPLTGGGSFLFIPKNGDWGVKYGGATAGNNLNNVNGDNIKVGGNDLLAPAASGNYKVSVDFQAGTYSVTKL